MVVEACALGTDVPDNHAFSGFNSVLKSFLRLLHRHMAPGCACNGWHSGFTLIPVLVLYFYNATAQRLIVSICNLENCMHRSVSALTFWAVAGKLFNPAGFTMADLTFSFVFLLSTIYFPLQSLRNFDYHICSISA